MLGVSILWLLAVAAAIALEAFARPEERPVPVRIVQQDGGFHLERGGRRYFIRGVGGADHLEMLARLGGNSIRTWDAVDKGNLLAIALRHDLSVTLGLWVGHTRHGFNYDDEQAVAAQQKALLQQVSRYKDHPAVLMWCVGNEMEGDGTNPKIWKAVNDIAAAIKEMDPSHPVMTVIADANQTKVEALLKYCPAIDILGVNSYGGITTIAERLRQHGWTKPYVVTEFGPLGPWEVRKTAWQAPLEETSTAKAVRYREAYLSAVEGKVNCLGSYAFLWGQKQEATSTWFGMFLEDGARLAAVDEMVHCWTGHYPANRCPRIASLRPEPGEVRVGEALTAEVQAADPESDPLRIRWELRAESTDRRTGGDRESVPRAFPSAILEQGKTTTRVSLPAPGEYRLFVFVYDSHGNAATANVPLRAQ